MLQFERRQADLCTTKRTSGLQGAIILELEGTGEMKQLNSHKGSVNNIT